MFITHFLLGLILLRVFFPLFASMLIQGVNREFSCFVAIEICC